MSTSDDTTRHSVPPSSLPRKEREELAANNLDRKMASTPSWSEGGSYALPRPNRRPVSLPTATPLPRPSSSQETQDDEIVVEDVPSPRSSGVSFDSNLDEDIDLDSMPSHEGINSGEIVNKDQLKRRETNNDVPVRRLPTTSSGADKRVSLPTRQVVPSSFVTSGEWEEETVIEREDQKRRYWSGGSGFRVTERDVVILKFLGRYRYAQTAQIARYIDTSLKATQIRLSKMGKVNLVRREDITSGQSVWTATSAGLSVADLDIRVIGEGQISLVTMAHTLGAINLGIELEKGGTNLLGEPVWPLMNRVDLDTGEASVGEFVLTEREIAQGQNRWKKQKDRGQLRDIVQGRLEEWNESGRSTPSPELLPGNEGMFVLYSTAQASLSGTGEHVPDMVVARARDEDGSPNSVAIELELQSKPTDEWRRILRAYKASNMYGRLVYFTHKPAIRNALVRLNEEEVGIEKDKFQVRKYIPASGKNPFWG